MEKVFYWDSCVYLAWLYEEETHGDGRLDAILAIATENRQRKNTIITSTLTFTEVLNPGEEKENTFRGSFRYQDHIAYEVDPPIALKARELREYFTANRIDGKTLSTPDAIHLATAIIYRADQFHTFDAGKKDKKTIGLLQLNGHDALDRLVICKPFVAQPNLI